MNGRLGQYGAIAVALVIVLSIGSAAYLASAPPSPSGGTATARAAETVEGPNFAVSFVESGLPNGTWWSVTFENQTKTTPGESTITFPSANGTYSYTISSVGFIATPSSGTVTVSGTSQIVRVAFSNHVATYSVEFSEEGLPSGTNWTVSLNGTTQTSASPTIPFAEANGTYTFSITPIPGYTTTYSGEVAVEGATVTYPVTFNQSVYVVSYNETGLPIGTSWSVTVGPLTYWATSPTITTEEPNGSYAYSVGPVAGFSTDYSGGLLVDGAAVGIPVTFAPVTYAIVLTESGLPAGGGWTVDLAGGLHVVTARQLTVYEPNGSYLAVFHAGPDYRVSPAELNLTVEGAGTTGTVVFTAIPLAANFTESGLAIGTWSVTVNGTTESANAGAAIHFLLADGAYAYTVHPIAGYSTQWSGSLIVAGAPQTVALTFHQLNYFLRLTASGAPSGTGWTASIGATTTSTTGSSVAFSLPNGTYSFSTISNSTSWQTLAPFGNVTVAGANVELTIPFAYAYPATFDASNLPAGVTWTVNLTGQLPVAPSVSEAAAGAATTEVVYSYTSSEPVLSIPLPNGTYQYTIHTSSLSWTPSTQPSSLTVAGASPPPQTVTPSTGPGPSTAISSTLIAVIAAVALAVIVAVGAVSYRAVARRSGGGATGIDELYGSYELATDVDLTGGATTSDPLDDIF